MKKKAGKMAAVLLAAALLSGCGSGKLDDGMSLLEEGKYEEASEAFEEAAKKEPEAYRGLGMAKWELGEYEEAYEAFKAALDNGGKQTAQLYNLLGSCAMKLDRPKEALNYYSLGIAADDVSEELLREMRFNEVAALEQAGDWKSAEKKLESYIEDYPDDEKAAKEAEFLETR